MPSNFLTNTTDLFIILKSVEEKFKADQWSFKDFPLFPMTSKILTIIFVRMERARDSITF